MASSTELLPADVSTRKLSAKFVKRLLAIGISNIAYLRFNLPEEVPKFFNTLRYSKPNGLDTLCT